MARRLRNISDILAFETLPCCCWLGRAEAQAIYLLLLRFSFLVHGCFLLLKPSVASRRYPFFRWLLRHYVLSLCRQFDDYFLVILIPFYPLFASRKLRHPQPYFGDFTGSWRCTYQDHDILAEASGCINYEGTFCCGAVLCCRWQFSRNVCVCMVSISNFTGQLVLLDDLLNVVIEHLLAGHLSCGRASIWQNPLTDVDVVTVVRPVKLHLLQVSGKRSLTEPDICHSTGLVACSKSVSSSLSFKTFLDGTQSFINPWEPIGTLRFNFSHLFFLFLFLHFSSFLFL